MSTDKDKQVTFQNVAGLEEEKEDLEEIVDFLKEPQKLSLIHILTGLIRQVRERPADAEEGGELLWKTADLLRRDGVYAELALRNRTEEEIAGSGLDKSAKEG